MATKDFKATFELCKSIAKQTNEKIKKLTEANKDNPSFDVKNEVKEEIASLNANFIEFMDFMKAYLIMANDALYGTILLGIDTEVNYNVRAFVDLAFKRGNYIIRFNPLFISNYSFTELTGKVVGEILRLIFDHVSSYADINAEKDAEKHNLLEDASSAAVNTLIERDIRLDVSSGRGARSLKVSEDTYTIADLMKETDVKPKEGEGLEYYFEILKKFRKRQSGNSSAGQPNGCGNSSGMQQSSQSGGQSGQGQGQSQNQSNGLASPNNNQGEYSHDWESSDSGKASDTAKDILQSAMNSLDNKRRGMIPSSILSQIEKMLAKPEITWKQILQKFIGAVPFPYKKTRKKLNRRQPERADLCGRIPKRKVNIVICIDTSGSMSDNDIAYCMNEIFHIAKANETKITVIECDAQVNRVYVAKKPSDIKPEVCGRGGTCFTPAIEYINEEGKFRDALMIYFTDGYGEHQIPKPRTYRNMWVVIGDEKYLSVENPYGEVKSLRMDGDYQKFLKGRR